MHRHGQRTHRPDPVHRGRRGRVLVAALAAALLGGCTGTTPEPAGSGGRLADAQSSTSGEPTVRSSPSPDGPAVPTPARRQPREAAEVLPEALPSDDPTALAAHLEQAVTVWRDEDADEAQVRRAAEHHQLAVRTIASAGDRFRTRALSRLSTRTRAAVRGEVRASRSLGGLGEPQRRLPRWRIVTPPPMSRLLGYYRAAQRRTGVPWEYFAAIHLVETRMGRIRGTSTAGAQGPMQFLPPTWELYGEGGDIRDARDAILAAGRLLAANGAPADMAGALWHYNPSQHYVVAVTRYARNLERAPETYRSYWHWRVLYRHTRGTYLLPVGYPRKPAVLLPGQ